MRVAITQATYLPWIGYFDLLDWVDLWISLDNVQMVRRSYHVRNRIITPQHQEQWLTIGTVKCPRNTDLKDVELNDQAWCENHWNKIKAYYSKAEYFEANRSFVEDLLRPREGEKYLAQINTRIIQDLAKHLGIQVEVQFASDIVPDLVGTAEDKILQLCDRIGPDAYCNFQGGVEAGLYDADNFTARGIEFYKQEYRHPEYNQTGSEFTPYQSVIDLILNEGPRAKEVILKGRRWKKLN